MPVNNWQEFVIAASNIAEAHAFKPIHEATVSYVSNLTGQAYEKLATENKLRRSERHFRAVVENAPLHLRISTVSHSDISKENSKFYFLQGGPR